MDEEFPGQVIVTRDNEVLSSVPCDLAGLMSCTHEEADTRMFVHATDGAGHGMNKILLRTVGTDVVVIGISMAQKIGCDSLWFAFGQIWMHQGIQKSVQVKKADFTCTMLCKCGGC